MAQRFNYTLKTGSDGKPTIDQQKIGSVSISFNPDDDKFYATDEETWETHASGKSHRNVIWRANRHMEGATNIYERRR